jgi:uncharacterized repeat protein (TIGR01451 family)
MRTAFLLTLLLLFGAAFAQGDNPINVRIEAYIVSEVTGEDGAVEERFTESTTARPGQVVEYRVFATNQDETTLPAGTVSVVGPIPEGSSYVDGSATPTSERVFTEFSADGETWGEPPLLTEGGEAVPPEEYEAVRWTLQVPMEPGQEEMFSYRVVIE